MQLPQQLTLHASAGVETGSLLRSSGVASGKDLLKEIGMSPRCREQEAHHGVPPLLNTISPGSNLLSWLPYEVCMLHLRATCHMQPSATSLQAGDRFQNLIPWRQKLASNVSI